MLQPCPTCSFGKNNRKNYFKSAMRLEHLSTVFEACVCCYHVPATNFLVNSSLFSQLINTHI